MKSSIECNPGHPHSLTVHIYMFSRIILIHFVQIFYCVRSRYASFWTILNFFQYCRMEWRDFFVMFTQNSLSSKLFDTCYKPIIYTQIMYNDHHIRTVQFEAQLFRTDASNCIVINFNSRTVSGRQKMTCW